MVDVLIAEDEVLIRAELAGGLRDMGLSVIEAANAQEAMTVLDKGEEVAVLVTDIKMPGALDGLELALKAL